MRSGKGGGIMGTTYGYARVSSRDQNLDRQLDALADFGVERARIFADRASGKDFERPQWRRLVGRLAEGDTLVVSSIDPSKQRMALFEDAKRSYLSGHITRHEAAARLEVSVSTFDRWMRRDREREG